MLTRLGWGGASVETVLRDGPVAPGGTLHGRVHIEGGEVDQRVDRLTVGLVVRLEDYSDVEFERIDVPGDPVVARGASAVRDFALRLPWDMPVTTHGDRRLKGMDVGVNTQLHIAGAVDPGDFDPFTVDPLPAQAAVLDALERLGFSFFTAAVKDGDPAAAYPGTGAGRGRSPVYQELRFYPPVGARGLDRLDATFVSAAGATDVLLRAETFDGVMSDASRTCTRFTADHAAGAPDWDARIGGWLAGLADRDG
ncbi:sporulation protein [Nocardiopsis trehalosi]|uniref:sporulation protein n=1 Tax=Nocardiopsis trehalosi TaxID=109329 RepID=UPI00082C1DE5|nr:sporulation protein [Nocardiopsis trehalosi]